MQVLCLLFNKELSSKFEIFSCLLSTDFISSNVKMDDDPKQRFIEQGSHKGKGIAVFTSGGDSPGMSLLY